MKISSATFVKSVIGTNDIFENGIPQVVFIGRSNVGKSSVINSLTGVKGLAKTSSFPGRTQQINLFLINKAFYLVDLPGYGYAKVHAAVREQIQKMINWYLFDSEYLFQKVVLIIDAKVGPTEDDLDMCDSLEKAHKEIVIVANKIDKIKKDSYDAQMAKIKSIFPTHKIIPYSAEKKIGIGALTENLLVY